MATASRSDLDVPSVIQLGYDNYKVDTKLK